MTKVKDKQTEHHLVKGAITPYVWCYTTWWFIVNHYYVSDYRRFSDMNISQSNLAMCLSYGRMFSYCFIISIRNWVVRYWHGYLSGVRCKWFAYGPADATATPSSLAPVNPEWLTILGATYPGCRSSSSSSYYKFTAKSVGEWVLITGRQLAKLRAKI